MQELPKVELHHMGLWVKDRHMMADFYCRLYGFHVSDRSSNGVWRRGATGSRASINHCRAGTR